MSARRRFASSALFAAVLAFTSPTSLIAQTPASSSNATEQAAPSTETLLAEIRRLTAAIEALQTQLAESRRETAEVQQSLQTLRDQLDEERELLQGQLSTIDQTKVESGSKYRVRLFGMALMQLISTRGAVDNIDLPNLAIESVPGDSGGNISAGVRQSYIGLAVFGPRVGNLTTSGDIRLDFFHGFPAANDGLSSPGVRLRTMQIAFDGPNTSVRAGQEAPFFSPLSPSSLASTAYPALSTSGNIWAWTPQVYVEHRVTQPNDTTLSLRAGVLDSLSGELPAGEYSRLATAGERSRMPALGGHVGVRHGAEDRVTSAGVGAYFARQNWGYDRTINSWATTADWELPLTRRVQVSGEVYAGTAIGGLGGGAHSSVLFDGAPDAAESTVFPLHSYGGWAQLKIKASPRTELNGAYGFDQSKPRGATSLLQPPNDETPSASRNASDLFNVIYQVRSNVFLSVEYRRLWTTRFDGRSWLADHLNLVGAVVF
ncbi:MAG: hypothetical protein U0Q11_12640 [Vicinamibacterales bacterium]